MSKSSSMRMRTNQTFTTTKTAWRSSQLSYKLKMTWRLKWRGSTMQTRTRTMKRPFLEWTPTQRVDYLRPLLRSQESKAASSLVESVVSSSLTLPNWTQLTEMMLLQTQDLKRRLRTLMSRKELRNQSHQLPRRVSAKSPRPVRSLSSRETLRKRSRRE